VQQVHGLLGRHQVVPRNGLVAEGDQPGRGHGRGQVAQHGHVLRAEDLVDQFGHAVEVDVPAILAVQAGGDARSRHGRLLGGHREVQQMDEHEADRVIHAEHEGFDQRRRAQVGHQDLEQGHEADDDAGARRREEHGAHLAAVFRDVVLARAAGIFRHIARQQVDIVGKQVADLVLVVVRLDQFQRQRDGTGAAAADGLGIVPVLRGIDRDGGDVHVARCGQLAARVDEEQQLAQAVYALRQCHQQIGEGDAGALVQGLLADLGDDGVALVQHHQQVARILDVLDISVQQVRIRVQVGVHFRVLHHEGRLEDFNFAVETRQFRLQAHGADAVGQGADGVEHAW